MAFDWLFGPPMRHPWAGGSYEIRSLTLEPDTVLEVLAMLKAVDPEAELVTQSTDEPIMGPVPLKDLREASAWDLQHLMIQSPGARLYVDFRAGQPVLGGHGDHLADVLQEVARKLLADGVPRVRWRHLLPALPVVVAAVLILSWLWYLGAEQPAWSLAIAGSLLVILACVSAWDLRPKIRGAIGRGLPGHRIREMSRLELRAHRANTRANLRVSVIAGVLGAIAGAVAMYLLVGTPG